MGINIRKISELNTIIKDKLNENAALINTVNVFRSIGEDAKAEMKENERLVIVRGTINLLEQIKVLCDEQIEEIKLS